jgi:DNA-binding beta-propeller fold protein YncE
MLFGLCLLFICSITIAQKDGLNSTVQLPNGWKLSPVGSSLPLGDLPLNIAVSKSGKLMAVTNNGQSVHSIQLIDPVTKKQLDQAIVPKAWYGLAFSADEQKLYASGGHDNRILVFSTKNTRLTRTDSISLGKPWPNKIGVAGLTIDDARKILYVVTRDDKMLYAVDLVSKQTLYTYYIGAEAYTCVLSPNKKTLYISVWGGDEVLFFDTEKIQVKQAIKVGDNPNELLLNQSGKILFVANANDNSVSVIETASGKELEVLNAALYPDAPSGSTSNGLALSADQRTLYIANADNNCLAVFDVTDPGKSKSKGFIPTGWYPTNVKVLGKNIFVSNGKGFSSQANPYGPNPARRKEDVVYQGGDKTKPQDVQYIAGLFKGTMSIIPEPEAVLLARYSKAVYANTPYKKEQELMAKGEKGNPIPMKVGDPSPMKYVFYIVKENRTYDQVLGDVPQGNGDTSLVLFGEKVTPNQHKLVKDFVLLDNFYVDAEVSADGHNWSLGAYATDYLEKNWPTSYGGRGGSYDAEGNRAVANNKAGFIWDHCKRHGVSYRTYGEFADNYKPNIPVLKGHICPYFTGWDESVRDTVRVAQWKRDFDSLVAIGQLPRLNTVRLINDHTEGLRKGKPTPFAHVADNDLAVGLFIEHLSKSPVWKESVVFIIEDDAQNGPDHVDAHRSTAYVAGPFVKRGFVDHTMYSTTSMLRTIELILGMPPMTQFDAAATPMYRCFTSQPDYTSFTHLPANINLNDKNGVDNILSKLSEGFDMSKEDAVPDLLFNEVLWKGIKGMHRPFPGPRRAAFVQLKKSGEKDDDD